MFSPHLHTYNIFIFYFFINFFIFLIQKIFQKKLLHFRNAVDIEVSDVEVYLDNHCCRTTRAEHFRFFCTKFEILKIVPFAWKSGDHFENEGFFSKLSFLLELTTFLSIFLLFLIHCFITHNSIPS